ncbi:MAG: rhomboid family intramembrane serine protease [Actinomycetota bacterium]|nr:rhomboid family intramembrane serine protease [Actinomycetota bacterium]
MLPIRDNNPTRHFAFVTVGLIAANFLVFLLWQPTFAQGQSAELKQQTFFWCHALIPYEVTHRTSLAAGGPEAEQVLQEQYGGPGSSEAGRDIQRFLQEKCPHKSWLESVFVSMFLHAGWLHIGGNMLFLWIFGNNIEDRLRPFLYLLFYLAGGVAATVLEVALAPNNALPGLGASGAIAAVLGAYLVLYPRARVTTAVIFFFITLIELPAAVVLGFWFLLQLFSGFGQLGTDVASGGVAYSAHVGGFVFGLVVGLIVRSWDRRRPAPMFSPRRPDVY